MTINKLAIIGGSGLYDVEEFENRELVDLQTPWGKPSDQILKTKYKNKEVYFLPRHGRGHFISPSKINFRANIDALKQLGVSDIVSVSAVGSLKEDLPPGKFVIVDQFIDRTFARVKTFFDEDIHIISDEYRRWLTDSSDLHTHPSRRLSTNNHIDVADRAMHARYFNGMFNMTIPSTCGIVEQYLLTILLN